MISKTFLDQAIALLEDIENSPDKKAWCADYTTWVPCPGQEELNRAIHQFIQQAYEAGAVVSDYAEIIETHGLEQRDIAIADPVWVGRRSYEELLACVAWHFRRDHFSDGALTCESIASGALLRLFQGLARSDAETD